MLFKGKFVRLNSLREQTVECFTSPLLLCSWLVLGGSPFLGELFVYMTVSVSGVFCLFVCFLFLSKHRGSRVLSSWMVHAGCVFVAGCLSLIEDMNAKVFCVCAMEWVRADSTLVYRLIHSCWEWS